MGYGQKIEVVLSTPYKGMVQKLQFKQLYIPFDNVTETVPALCFEIQKVYVTPSGEDVVLMSQIIPFADANRRVLRDAQNNIVTENYFESEITGYNTVPVLNELGEPIFEEDGITPITTQEPIYSQIEKTRNKTEGEVEYWLRTLGQLILPACQRTIESLKPLFDN